jgi:hypothetical protein
MDEDTGRRICRRKGDCPPGRGTAERQGVMSAACDDATHDNSNHLIAFDTVPSFSDGSNVLRL